MRFLLFKLIARHTAGQHEVYVVAPNETRAEEVAREMVPVCDGAQLVLERVDDNLPDDCRKGLDAMLDEAPVGLAYYNAADGWIAQPLPLPKLKLFKIEIAGEGAGYIAAPDMGVASAVFFLANPPPKGETLHISIYEWVARLPADMLRGLEEFLEFAPIGIVSWSAEKGWVTV